ncbi:hypothetical protein TI04_10415, partial [Achromatium sp. WMS2]
MGGNLELSSRCADGEWYSTVNMNIQHPERAHGTTLWFDLWLTVLADREVPTVAATAPELIV